MRSTTPLVRCDASMRLGAMLWLGAHDAPGAFLWKPEKKALTLDIEARAKPLFGEVAQARLKALGQALGAEAKVVFAE